MTGNVDGTKISFGAVEGTKTITYVGTVSGRTMSGTYSSEWAVQGHLVRRQGLSGRGRLR